MKQSACVLVIQDGQVLAVSRKDNFTIFGLPGGTVEKNESVKKAAIRETKEETGIIVSDLVELHIAQCGEYLCTTFFAQKYLGDPKRPTEDEGLVQWMSVDDFLSQNAFKKYNTTVINKWKKAFHLF